VQSRKATELIERGLTEVDPGFVILTVFSKGERADLSRAERNGLAKLVKTLRSSLVGKVPQLRRQS
jgi:hypothetical protein